MLEISNGYYYRVIICIVGMTENKCSTCIWKIVVHLSNIHVRKNIYIFHFPPHHTIYVFLLLIEIFHFSLDLIDLKFLSIVYNLLCY